MASAFSHAIAASAISSAFYQAGVPKRVWIMGIACSVLPDLDVIGFRLGIHYSDFWGEPRVHAFLGLCRDSRWPDSRCDPATSVRDASPLPVWVHISGYGQPRPAGRNDQWWTGSRLLFPLRQPSLFPPLETHSRFAHWDFAVFHGQRICRPSDRNPVDMGSFDAAHIADHDIAAGKISFTPTAPRVTYSSSTRRDSPPLRRAN